MWQNVELTNTVIGRNLFNSQQICHGTEGKTEKQIIVAKGYYDFAFEIYKRMNLEPEKNLK